MAVPGKIVLGSSSPYRQQILREMGYTFEVISPGIDERRIRDPDPEQLALALALAKGDAVVAQVTAPALVITADQVVTHGGEIREKPRTPEEARHFLHTAGDAPAETVSAVVVAAVPSGRRASGVDVVRIYLDPLPEELIERLIEDGEIFHCAGGLRLEDPLVQPYVRRMEGTLDSVMGLPRLLTRRLIADVLEEGASTQ